MTALTEYESRQLALIRAWQSESPGWGTRLLAKPGSKIAGAVQAMVPEDALRAALDGVNRMAEKLSGDKSILKRAGVQSLDQLRAQDLELCDRLMRTEQRRAMAMAGVGGAAFGVAGAAGMVADVPTLIGLALRTIHRVGLCYGEDLRNVDHRKLAIGVFALASANSLEEKQTAVVALRDFRPRSLDAAAWRDGVERAAERELAKEAAVFSLQNLARKLGINLGQRKAAGVVPVLGALIGGSVNAWYLYDIAQVSRYVFQERWLGERHSLAVLTKAISAPASK
ncbi:MAG: EcsC family protein [Panacagrimonas sp.]